MFEPDEEEQFLLEVRERLALLRKKEFTPKITKKLFRAQWLKSAAD